MKNLSLKTLKAFLLYPLTWMVIITIFIAHYCFNLWFEPPLIINILCLLFYILTFIIWIFLSFHSHNFLDFYDTMLYKIKIRKLQHILEDCHQDFKIPAIQCVDILQKINKEFHNNNYYETELFLENLYNLSSNHRKIYRRFMTFGTEEQRNKMQSIINQQIDAIKNTLNFLKSFSGNITILSASVEKNETAIRELRFINQGMQEVIQELDDEK